MYLKCVPRVHAKSTHVPGVRARSACRECVPGLVPFSPEVLPYYECMAGVLAPSVLFWSILKNDTRRTKEITSHLFWLPRDLAVLERVPQVSLCCCAMLVSCRVYEMENEPQVV